MNSALFHEKPIKGKTFFLLRSLLDGWKNKNRILKNKRKIKKNLLSKSIFMCNGKELWFLLIPIERLVPRIWNHNIVKNSWLVRSKSKKIKKSAYTTISSTSNLYIRIADRGIIQGVRSTYFIFLSNFLVGLIRTFFVLLINNRTKKIITHLFYSNKPYMEMSAEDKIYLILSLSLYRILERKKKNFLLFFINIKKKEYNKNGIGNIIFMHFWNEKKRRILCNRYFLLLSYHENLSIWNGERWLSGLKRRIANPLYNFFVPRVRIPLFPSPRIIWDFRIVRNSDPRIFS